MGKADRELLKIGQQSGDHARGFAHAISAESTILTENGLEMAEKIAETHVTLLGWHPVPTKQCVISRCRGCGNT
jgi:hypothetical protein